MHTGEVEHTRLIRSVDFEQAQRIYEKIRACSGIVYWMGNGGSAADSQHMAAELMGLGIPSIALTTDSSVLTALGNDIGFDEVFAHQVKVLCKPNDILIGLTTSGLSANILRGFEVANCYTIAFSGKRILDVDECVCVDSDSTPRIQEVHEFIGHTIYEWAKNSSQVK